MRFSTQAGVSGDNRGPNTLITSNFIAYEEFSTVSTLQDQGCSSSCTGGAGGLSLGSSMAQCGELGRGHRGKTGG